MIEFGFHITILLILIASNQIQYLSFNMHALAHLIVCIDYGTILSFQQTHQQAKGFLIKASLVVCLLWLWQVVALYPNIVQNLCTRYRYISNFTCKNYYTEQNPNLTGYHLLNDPLEALV